MKWAVLAAGLFALAGPAMAQTTTTTTTTTRTVITPGERTEIRRYVTTRHVRPFVPPPGFRATAGAALPGTVVLHRFPPSAPYGRYRYTVIGRRTVVVDPATHRVIETFR